MREFIFQPVRRHILTVHTVDVTGADWGYKTAFLFLGTGTITCVIAYFYVPEPSQRNSAEMDEMYEKHVPARRMKKYVTDVQKQRQVTRSSEGRW